MLERTRVDWLGMLAALIVRLAACGRHVCAKQLTALQTPVTITGC